MAFLLITPFSSSLHFEWHLRALSLGNFSYKMFLNKPNTSIYHTETISVFTRWVLNVQQVMVQYLTNEDAAAFGMMYVLFQVDAKKMFSIQISISDERLNYL